VGPKIIIIEDERDLVDVLSYNLKREGYQVNSALTGREGIKLITDGPLPDLLLLDLMLPDMQGTEICKLLRNDSRTKRLPIIMLTAKGEEIDRVVGFEVGADDYVVKPFSVRELMLRIKALLRRTDDTEQSTGVLCFGCLKIDVPAHRVSVDEQEIPLTALEFRLLVTFFERRGRVQSRDVLLEDVWDIHADVTTRTVDTHVKRLREKLEKAGGYIETIRGVGYRFRAASE
jgi:two-component system, OmpR family, phosphate regulon response regulator PhoB